MSKKQIGKTETLGVGGLSSFVLLVVNETCAGSDWLTVIQAAVPFCVSLVVYILLYLLSYFGVDDLETYSVKKQLKRKKVEIKRTLDEAKERGAETQYIAQLNHDLNETEQAILSLYDTTHLKISKVE